MLLLLLLLLMSSVTVVVVVIVVGVVMALACLSPLFLSVRWRKKGYIDHSIMLGTSYRTEKW